MSYHKLTGSRRSSMSKPRKRCIFCGGSGMSKEHIWGDWLKHHVKANLPKHSLGTLIVNPPGTPNVSSVGSRTGDPLRSKVRVVCETCNNTWLSAIQNRVKPLLIPMIGGQPCVLSHDKQQTLATWITMATMTSEFMLHEKTQISVSQADREWLWEKYTPPSDWRIWIGRYQRHRSAEQWVHCSVPIYDVAPVVADGEGPQCNTQSTTFIIGEFFGHAMSAAFPNHARDWDWRVWPRAHQVLSQIWPLKESAIVWPTVSVSMIDADAINIARAFFAWVDNIGRLHGHD
jgi:hypothetical protein